MFEKYLAYSASAGSGKTFRLSVRYISLLFMGVNPSSILAATFTKKAASEMRSRVIDSLRDINKSDNLAFLEEVSKESRISTVDILNAKDEVLERFLSSSNHIVTIDSFFASILRSASFEIGLEPDFETKDIDIDEFQERFLKRILDDNQVESFLQLKEHLEDKRFDKIFNIMGEFYKLDAILPKDIIYTTNNIKEIEANIERLRVELILALEEVGASNRAIKQFETSNIKELFNKGLFEKNELIEHSWFKKYSNTKIENIYEELKIELKKWINLKEAIILRHLMDIYSNFRSSKLDMAISSNSLSFDDLGMFVYLLLYGSVSREFIYFKMDSKFEHILLDEFQDTSILQFLLFKPLIDELFSKDDDKFRSFFFVGDTKQSLYRFRGGVEELFNRVANIYNIPIKNMNINYRSASNIVKCVNRAFNGVIDGYQIQHSRDGIKDGFVNVVESVEPIEDAIIEAKRLIDSGANVDDIAFLVSTNKDGVALQNRCFKNGIDNILQTSSSLELLANISAIVSMIEYLYDGNMIDAKAILLKYNIEDFDKSWYSHLIEPYDACDKLINIFELFHGDVNILKLLEFASKFRDIPTFIEEFRNSSLEISSNTIHGARIMTIHGSKGLEFAHVIVVDRSGRKSPDHSAMIYNYNDELEIDKVALRYANRDNFDEDYQEIIANRKKLNQKDALNVLYVALTRAVSSMIIIKKPKDSIFDMVEIVPIGKLEIEAPKERKKSPTSKDIKLSYYGKQNKRNSEDDIVENSEAINYGLALHYSLEMLNNLDSKFIDSAMDSTINRYGNILKKDILDDIKLRVLNLTNNIEFQNLLKDAKFYKEISISFEGNIKQIDLLIEYENSYIVADYKSSKKFHIKYISQIKEYQKAIKSITQKDTKAILIYILDSGIEIIEID